MAMTMTFFGIVSIALILIPIINISLIYKSIVVAIIIVGYICFIRWISLVIIFGCSILFFITTTVIWWCLVVCIIDGNILWVATIFAGIIDWFRVSWSIINCCILCLIGRWTWVTRLLWLSSLTWWIILIRFIGIWVTTTCIVP